MKLDAILPLGVPLLYLLLLAFEVRYGARPYETVPHWRRTGAAFFLATMIIGSLTPLLLPVAYLKSYQLFDLSDLGMWGLLAGVPAVTFINYWLHRAEHRFDWLWRATHQLHHSPVRVDLWGAFYTHPLEVMLKVSVGVLVSTGILGLARDAAAAAGLITAALSIFQHWNVNTPRVLGYFLPRPESHGLHHERDIHARNFGDLPLWDMLFGTFENPKRFDGKTGFAPPLDMRIGDMLLLRDVTH